MNKSIKTNRILLFTVFFSLLFAGCSNDDIDSEVPVIDISANDAFPINCDTLYFGEPFTLKIHLSDNQELGSFSIDIHNNFDHHSHSTEVTECSLNEVKDAVNAYTYIEEFDIAEGLSDFDTNLEIDIPSGNDEGNYDEGDYHFFISLTDKEGWSAQTGLSIKMMYR